MSCWFLSRAECALLLSIYGVSVSAALLSVLGLHGHQFGPGFPAVASTVLHHTCLTVYSVSLVTNLTLLAGLLLASPALLVPWLLAHGLLVVALAAASIYYLVLYTVADCGVDCYLLLVYSVALILVILVLVYCIYTVQDHRDRLVHDRNRLTETLQEVT